MKVIYTNPLDLVSLFNSPLGLKDVFDSCAEELIRLNQKNENDDEYVPPVVYNDLGKVFNIDYNFLIHCLGYLIGDESVAYELCLHESSSLTAQSFSLLLVAGLFEKYLKIIRTMNTYKVDLTRYKNARQVSISVRAYNPLLVRNGSNFRTFFAVPFDVVKVRNLMDGVLFNEMYLIAAKPSLSQIAFGEKQCNSFRTDYPSQEIHRVF